MDLGELRLFQLQLHLLLQSDHIKAELLALAQFLNITLRDSAASYPCCPPARPPARPLS